MKKEIVETDVFIAGGGIAGLMAAIRAAEIGVKVTLAEKANTLRSGAGATGNDHFICYVPELCGPDLEKHVERNVIYVEKASIRNKKYVRKFLAESFKIVQLWDKWGIPMRPTGKWEYSGHAVPGVEVPEYLPLKYAGANQKKVLTEEAIKRGVKIINRVTVFDLLNGKTGVYGAIGVDTREERVLVFKAKSVILATGICARLYPAPTPGWMFNMSDPPSTTGEGRAMAYRAGAELVNMEIPRRWAGPKYFARNGKGTWIGVFRDAADKPVGPYVTRPDKRYGDAIADHYSNIFETYSKNGKGPIHMDCRGITESDYEYMIWGLTNEGNTSLLDYLKDKKIDPRKNPIEFMTYEIAPRGGVHFNEYGETSVKGLYAAGDEYFGGIAGAAVIGYLAGESAAAYTSKAKTGAAPATDKQIKEKMDMLNEMLGRKNGASWKEVNTALSQVMNDYAGTVKSESLLKTGLANLLQLKERACSEMGAANQHELMHCLEVLNLFDVAESVFRTSMFRKETRDDFVRADYPYLNPQYNNKMIIYKKKNEKPFVSMRDKNQPEKENATSDK